MSFKMILMDGKALYLGAKDCGKFLLYSTGNNNVFFVSVISKL